MLRKLTCKQAVPRYCGTEVWVKSIRAASDVTFVLKDQEISVGRTNPFAKGMKGPRYPLNLGSSTRRRRGCCLGNGFP